MTQVLGGYAGPDGVGGSYLDDIETDRTALWYSLGARQGVISGLTWAGVSGLMALDIAAGAALVSELDGSGNQQDRGYLVRNPATTRVTFGPASASTRNDALVVAFVDTEDGPVGTGGLAVGGHLVAVPGVSGTSTPRTDAQIRAWLGRGGYYRLADVPIASTDTQINTAGIVSGVPALLPVRKAASSSPAVTTSVTDVPGLTATVGVSGTADTFTVSVVLAIHLDVSVSGGNTVVGVLTVDGVDQSGVVLGRGDAGYRANCSQQWVVTGVAAGARVFKVRVSTGANSVYSIGATDSTMLIQRATPSR